MAVFQVGNVERVVFPDGKAGALLKIIIIFLLENQ
jgi:hypothetical protein